MYVFRERADKMKLDPPAAVYELLQVRVVCFMCSFCLFVCVGILECACTDYGHACVGIDWDMCYYSRCGKLVTEFKLTTSSLSPSLSFPCSHPCKTHAHTRTHTHTHARTHTHTHTHTHTSVQAMWSTRPSPPWWTESHSEQALLIGINNNTGNLM